MLDWLRRKLHQTGTGLSAALRRYIYDMVHAVGAFLTTIIFHVGTNWNWMLRQAAHLDHGMGNLADGLWGWGNKIVHHVLPALRKWAARQLAHLLKLIGHWVSKFVKELAHLKSLVERWLKDLEKWVIRHVYDPLKKWADHIWARLLDWGYVAYRYITHPQMLADLIFDYLLVTFTRRAWAVARVLGEWIFKTFMANIPRSVTLIEKIITDVL